ncbi:MAG: Gfo/Idh/MocA family oxidoreductase [Clostridium sp.]|nr:Gfo/Idh/MocA family oxidoreductase [Clostridium sp.]
MVRIAIVGLGQRGTATLGRFLGYDGVRIAALCDLDPERVAGAAASVAQTGQPRPATALSADDLPAVCPERIDLAVICTDWQYHAPLACSLMERGIDVAVEVPLATTVDEARRVVETAGRTGRFCLMMENCCYDPFTLRSAEMVRRGALGDIVHLEGAYIHDIRRRMGDNRWFNEVWLRHPGNPYPTHALGPVCTILDAAGGDRLLSLTSLTGHDSAGRPRFNSSLIRTERGRTILLQHDVTTPRPYSRLQSVTGTLGYLSKYPLETVVAEAAGPKPLTGPEAVRYMELYEGEVERRWRETALRRGVDNMMNYYMDCELLRAVRLGLGPGIPVRAAALWSCVGELTALSATCGGTPVPFPRF